MDSSLLHGQVDRWCTVTDLATINVVSQLIENYRNRSEGKDQYVARVLVYEESEAAQVESICRLFYEVLKHEDFLECVIRKFYEKFHRRNRNDFALLKVMLFLILFTLKEDNKDEVSSSIFNLHSLRSFQLLQYLLSKSGQHDIECIAKCVYDVEFTKRILLPFLNPSNLYKELFDSITNKKKTKTKHMIKIAGPIPKVHVNVQPPPPPPPCTPEKRRPGFKFPRPVPKSTYEKSEIKIVRSSPYVLLEKSRKMAFKCSLRSQKFLNKVQEESPEILQYKFASRTPHFSKNVPIKVNASTILREGAALMKDEEKALKRLQDLASGCCSIEQCEEMFGFLREEQHKQDLLNIERKHLKGLLTHEEAALAKRTLLNLRKEQALQFKQEKEELDKKLQELREEANKKIEELVDKSRNIEQAALAAKKETQEQKQKAVKEMVEENRLLLEQALQKKEDELAKRIQMIKEIRALQGMRTLNIKEFDATETMGLGLLCEMSLAELNERLLILKVDLQEEVKKRHQNIIKERERRKRLITDTEDYIKRHRITRKVPPSLDEAKNSEMPYDEELQQLKLKLKEKRDMREKLSNLSLINNH